MNNIKCRALIGATHAQYTAYNKVTRVIGPGIEEFSRQVRRHTFQVFRNQIDTNTVIYLSSSLIDLGSTRTGPMAALTNAVYAQLYPLFTHG